jgi:hypothetical protein
MRCESGGRLDFNQGQETLQKVPCRKSEEEAETF